MKKLILILLLTRCFNSFCQDISARFIDLPDYVEFKGSIDSKYDITMNLYPSSKFAFGKYSYDKINKEISLKGTIVYVYGFFNDKYYEKEEVKLFEYDELDNKKAVFEGEIIDNSTFKGIWTDISTKKTLPFDLKVSNYKSLNKRNRYLLEK